MELKVEKVRNFSQSFSWITNQVSHHVIICNHINNIPFVTYIGVIGLKFIFFRFLVNTFTLMRVDKIVETILMVSQKVKRY